MLAEELRIVNLFVLLLESLFLTFIFFNTGLGDCRITLKYTH